MNGVLSWLVAQAHVMTSVLGAVISNQPAPARQVVIYAAVLVALLMFVPRTLKKFSK